MSDCVFCKIAMKAVPAYVVQEDADTLAFLDIHPRAPGHTMVVPKAHMEKLADCAEAQISTLFAAVRRVAALLRERLRADGLTIGINEGEASGQTVGHLHVHLIPRFRGDGGGSLHSVVENPPHESIEALQKKLAS
jgi:histidine triad (HIT) family protein